MTAVSQAGAAAGTDSDPLVVVLCTCPPAEADRLVDALLEERLIACANAIGPVTSRYRWEGKIESAEESLLVLKTVRSRVIALRQRIEALHSYDVPEVLECAVDGGLPAYLDWVRASCRPPRDEP